MGRRSGAADLPLHGGRVPPWLAARMARLGRVIVEALVLHYGRHEVLRRLAHPFWFQSLGAVMGMDWHSSGITTSVLGALKRGLAPVERELGLHVCGGRGRHSRRTPEELALVGERTGLDGDALARTSRLVAKVDNAAIQDGFSLYLHGFVVADDGAWAVVQQGMNPAGRVARRYHWLSEQVRSFVDAPHAAIEGPRCAGPILNLTDGRAAPARGDVLGLVQAGPDRALAAVREARRAARCASPLSAWAGTSDRGAEPHLVLPFHHDVRPEDVDERRLHAALAAAAAAPPADFEGLLLTPGLGPRTLESLTLVSEVIHGRPARFADPARFSLAHGGKDGHPFPVPLAVYDQTLRVLRDAVRAARLGDDDKLAAIRRLDEQARRLEPVAAGEGVAAYVERERRLSHLYGGRTVSGPARPPSGQPRLPGF
jgi:hypothetical protein